MKYDDWSWHAGGDFPADLPAEAGATHTGMFLAWAVLAGLVGEIHLEDWSSPRLERLKERTITPGEFFLEACDGKFTNEDLSDEGNAFTQVYFDLQKGQFIGDYTATLGNGLEGKNIYRVQDTWENYERLKPILDRRLAEWRASR